VFLLLQMTLEFFEGRINITDCHVILFEQPHCMNAWMKNSVVHRQLLEIVLREQFLKSASWRFLNTSRIGFQQDILTRLEPGKKIRS
jgi:hypothetical protein